MLPIIFAVVVWLSIEANAQNQAVSLSTRDSIVASLESFCYYIPESQQPDFSTTCTTDSFNQPLSSSLDQFCSYFAEWQDLFRCRAVIGNKGGPPYPLAPGYEKSPNLQGPNTIIIRPSQQPGGQPVFITQGGQQIFLQKPVAGAGGTPVFTIQQQPAPQAGGDGRQIIINVNGTQGNPGRPNIAEQAITRAPEPPSPANQGPEPKSPAAEPQSPAAQAPAPVPAEVDITSLVFSGEGDKMVTRCPPNTPITWAYKTWTEGNIRPYYENYGPKSSLEDCIKVCESKEECFFATFPLATRQCWLLTSTHPEKCNYHTGPHYGALLDPCSPAQPCPSAYKRCAKPNCWLQSIVDNFCRSGSKRQAVTSCRS